MSFEEYMPTRDGKRKEIWPNFDCNACKKEGSRVSYEEYSGSFEFVCSKCGALIPEEKVKSLRPDEETLPIIRILHKVKGISCENENFLSRFNDYEEFINANKSDFEKVYGVSSDIADRIVKRRDWMFDKQKVLANIEDEFKENIEDYKETGDSEHLEEIAEYLYDQKYRKYKSALLLTLEKYYS